MIEEVKERMFGFLKSKPKEPINPEMVIDQLATLFDEKTEGGFYQAIRLYYRPDDERNKQTVYGGLKSIEDYVRAQKPLSEAVKGTMEVYWQAGGILREALANTIQNIGQLRNYVIELPDDPSQRQEHKLWRYVQDHNDQFEDSIRGVVDLIKMVGQNIPKIPKLDSTEKMKQGTRIIFDSLKENCLTFEKYRVASFELYRSVKTKREEWVQRIDEILANKDKESAESQGSDLVDE